MDDAGAYRELRDSSPQRRVTSPRQSTSNLRMARSSSLTGRGSDEGIPRTLSSSTAPLVSRRNPGPLGVGAQASQPLTRGQPAKLKPKMKPKQHIISGPQGRSTIGRERFVALEAAELQSGDSERPAQGPSRFEDVETLRERGRITIYCLAESTDLKLLEQMLTDSEHTNEGKMEKYPEVIYSDFRKIYGPDASDGDVFFFDYGVIACWGLDEEEEVLLNKFASPCLVDLLDAENVEVDEIVFQYTSSEKPHIQNDTVTLNRRFAGIHEVKMAICHAFAQSTKLALFEEQVQNLVEDTRELPEKLAEEGEVHMDRKDINKLIGQVFLQKAAVNLLSTVLDTPEYFWSAPDSLQALYKRVCDYLEMDDRVELLNRRFSVLQEMLDMLRDQINNAHGQRLEWIVIWLIVVEVVIGIFECLSILGWVGPGDK